nr:MAG TPA: hypothetical protein [Caudoviricetes sp.]
MINPMTILQQLPAFKQISPLLDSLQGAPNPMALLQQKFGNDPAFKKAMDTVQGKSPQEIEQFAKNMLATQMNIKL